MWQSSSVASSSVAIFIRCLFIRCLFIRCLFIRCLFIRCLFIRCLFIRCLFIRCLFIRCLFIRSIRLTRQSAVLHASVMPFYCEGARMKRTFSKREYSLGLRHYTQATAPPKLETTWTSLKLVHSLHQLHTH